MSMPPYGPQGRTPEGSAPRAPEPTPTPQASAPPRAPLALAALIICAAAFVLGWIPLLGAVLGGVGIVLVILAARRGLATKRTYAGAAAAALGVLASAAMTFALIGVVVDQGDGPDPVAAAEEAEGPG